MNNMQITTNKLHFIYRYDRLNYETFIDSLLIATYK